MYFLYFHAIELYLKSYLMAFGFTEGQLRKRKYGHNICCLANEAEGHGLTLADTDRHVVLHLSESDNIMTSRYIKLGVHSRLPFDVLHETCYRLHAEIGPKAYEGSGVTRRPVLPPGPVNMLKSIESRLNARD
ncbi:hypothetical protein R2601_09098 [Salipiger bermudensis HTCC2601]|uniref:Uncharacterized protein n=1 Tax=Salipiger bermudensis (strain DSM 26914 / JCM 13377 / KCTC 12554 / HTCC2601) TaxID=314265 RepID=Q0FN87_SALBH|nr:hypothetical protein R2601_09098 [Salipiger bermudensis HTCC2601]